jgi:hypothetical protein
MRTPCAPDVNYLLHYEGTSNSTAGANVTFCLYKAGDCEATFFPAGLIFAGQEKKPNMLRLCLVKSNRTLDSYL